MNVPNGESVECADRHIDMADAGEIGLPHPALRPRLLALSDTADVGIVQSAPRAADPTDDLDGRHRIAKAEDLLMCGVEILDELLNVGVRTEFTRA